MSNSAICSAITRGSSLSLIGRIPGDWERYSLFADASRRAAPMNPCGRGGIPAANTRAASCSFSHPHLIDIIVALLGRPQRVTSFSQNLDDTFPWAQDNTAAVFEYPDAMATIESTAAEVSSGESRRLEVYGTRGSAILEPLDPPALRLCLDEDRDGYAEGWQRVEIEKRPSHIGDLKALVADIRGEKSPDRSLDHEFTVQETVLRAAGLL